MTRLEYETTVAQQEAQMFFAINDLKDVLLSASKRDVEFIIDELNNMLALKGYTITKEK